MREKGRVRFGEKIERVREREGDRRKREGG